MIDKSNRWVCEEKHGHEIKYCLAYDCDTEKGSFDNENRIGDERKAEAPKDCCKMCSDEGDCVAWSFSKKYRECSLYWKAVQVPSHKHYIEVRSYTVNQCHLTMPHKVNGMPQCKGGCEKYNQDCFFDKHSYDCACAAPKKDALSFCAHPKCKNRMKDSSNRWVCEEETEYETEKCLALNCKKERGTYDNKYRIGFPKPSKNSRQCCKKCSQNDNCVVWSFAPKRRHKLNSAKCSIYHKAKPIKANRQYPEYRSKTENQCHMVMPTVNMGQPQCVGSCEHDSHECVFNKRKHDCECAALEVDEESTL